MKDAIVVVVGIVGIVILAYVFVRLMYNLTPYFDKKASRAMELRLNRLETETHRLYEKIEELKEED